LYVILIELIVPVLIHAEELLFGCDRNDRSV